MAIEAVRAKPSAIRPADRLPRFDRPMAAQDWTCFTRNSSSLAGADRIHVTIAGGVRFHVSEVLRLVGGLIPGCGTFDSSFQGVPRGANPESGFTARSSGFRLRVPRTRPGRTGRSQPNLV